MCLVSYIKYSVMFVSALHRMRHHLKDCTDVLCISWETVWQIWRLRSPVDLNFPHELVIVDLFMGLVESRGSKGNCSGEPA